ncbi:DUF7373 family lipoprotein [Nocardia sp. IFM 10818]
MRAVLAAATAVAVLATVSCGSESGAADVAAVDLTKLDTGSYPTQPQPWEPKDRDRAARILEALRLGNIMPVGNEVDPSLKFLSAAKPFVDPGLSDHSGVFGWLNATDFTRNTPGYISGFVTTSKSSLDTLIATRLTNSVLIFDSETAATAAAVALGASGFAKNDDAVPTRSTRFPAAVVLWQPKYQVLASWYATGKFVIIDLIVNQENGTLDHSDLGALLDLSDKAIEVTSARLKDFGPTAREKLTELPLDPAGMQRLTLPDPDADWMGTLDSHGALHMADGLDNRSPELYEKAGVDNVSFGAGELVRARDADAAADLMLASSRNRELVLIESPPGLSIARCLKYRGPKASTTVPYYCYVSFGRYAARVWSDQLQDAQQRIAAQYAILVNGG